MYNNSLIIINLKNVKINLAISHVSLITVSLLSFDFRTLQVYKNKAVGAKKGFDLLKKKSDALKKAFRGILELLVTSKARMGSDYKTAMLSFAQATYAAGDFSRAVIEQVKTKSSIRLNVNSDNIAGVHMPKFFLRGEEDNDDGQLLGLAGGGQAILNCREKF